MTPPEVQIRFGQDGENGVWVAGQKLPGLLDVSFGMNGAMPVVRVSLAPGSLSVDLAEAGVQLLSAGPTASEFAASLSPARLEQAALASVGDVTTGEAFCAAVADAARLFDDRR